MAKTAILRNGGLAALRSASLIFGLFFCYAWFSVTSQPVIAQKLIDLSRAPLPDGDFGDLMREPFLERGRIAVRPRPDHGIEPAQSENEWAFQILPEGILYPAYLAGEKESRFRSFWANDENVGNIWDITLGGRAGIFRYGTSGHQRPQGWQLGIEGAGIPRLDLDHENELISADFRFGIPASYAVGRYQTKLAYYHLSSHLGDEFLIRNPGFERFNYSRDVLVWGHAYYPADALRLYMEIGWAFASDVAEPWEYQFGIDYSPSHCTGIRGAPFAAVNGSLREEVDFGGNFVFQTGWAWRENPVSGLFRVGFELFAGKSDQFSFFNQNETKLGLGLWYDY